MKRVRAQGKTEARKIEMVIGEQMLRAIVTKESVKRRRR